ncbi:MAG: hpch/hpai aldolase [Hyphomicrobiales bacterium]|nr:hpch/hpai aldolase [Hyphomicrobiales bacterium]
MTSFREMTETKTLKVGTYVGQFATPGLGRILKSTGCQFAFVDMEHSGFSFETIRDVLGQLHDVGIATVTRPPSQAAHHLARLCDVGAQGLVPPMLSTVDQARACLDAIKYAPQGRRGCAFGIAHDDYNPQAPADALAAGNARTAFTPLIETAEGIENVDAIAALDGVDCLWIGHLDLSVSLGIPGDYESPTFKEAVAAVMAAAQRNAKSVGRLIGSPEEAARVHGEGVDFICYLGDVWLLQKALSEGFAGILDRIGEGTVAGGG